MANWQLPRAVGHTETKLSNHPVVLFVHGTWSNPTVWEKLETYLANSDEIPKSVVFRRVKWSGGNSAFARSEGITEFEKIAAEYAERRCMWSVTVTAPT